MKHENYRNKRKANSISIAIIGLFAYIVAILLFKGLLNLFGNTGEYRYLFGVVEFLIISAGLIFYNWWSFKDASLEKTRDYIMYLIMEMIPITVMTLLTILVMYIGTNDTFTSNWNVTSFIIAPTVFVYLPYGIILEIFEGLPIVAFMPICLIYMAGIQFIGYLLGAKNRAYIQERELVRIEHEKTEKARQREMAQTAAIKVEEVRLQQAVEKEIKPKHKKEILDDIEQPAVIETEAFSKITDEMIEEAVRQRKIKIKEEKKASRTVQVNENSKAVEIENTKRATQNLSKELELIRQKMQQKDK